MRICPRVATHKAHAPTMAGGEAEFRKGPSSGGHNRDKSSHCPQGKKWRGKKFAHFPQLGIWESFLQAVAGWIIGFNLCASSK